MIGMAWQVIKFVKLHFFTYGYDLPTRYGKGTWAFITGGSEGFGKVYAKLLAKQGFNLVLVAEGAKKLEIA